MASESNQRSKISSRSFEAASHILENNTTRLLAAGIYATNVAFNMIHQGQPLAVSALHGIANMVNSGLYSVDWHQFTDLWDYAGLASQAGMYLTAGVVAGNVITKAYTHELRKMQGELPIKLHDGVLLADRGKHIPFFTHLGKMLRGKDAKLKNIALARVTTDEPNRSADEKQIYEHWAADRGEVSEAWLNSDYWQRAGAREAKVIVINTPKTDESLLAAGVIRSQIENTDGQIVVIDTDPEFHRAPEANELHTITGEYNTIIINPFLEVASQVVAGLKKKDTSVFLPHDGKERLEKKTAVMAKLQTLSNKPVIYLDGVERGGDEKTGLTKALSYFGDDVEITLDPTQAEVVLQFGSGEITNDVDAVKKSENTDIPTNALRLAVVFNADNEDTAVINHEGTVSIQQAVNIKLQQIIEPHVKKSTPIWNKLKRLMGK